MPRLLVFLWCRLAQIVIQRFVERRKWDAARNPVPFGKVAVVFGQPRTIEPLSDLETIEENCRYLQSALEELSRETRKFPGHQTSDD